MGFIRDLPHGLIDAFAATLQEAADADLLLHVVDASASGWLEQMEQVQRVLGEIGAGAVPQVLVFNKIDALEIIQQPLHLHDSYAWQGDLMQGVFVSARNGLGVRELRAVLSDIALGGVALDNAPTNNPEILPEPH